MNLIRRSQADDKEAFAELFHQYQDLVYKTAYLMLGNAGEAEDVLQEVFLQVYRSLVTFDPSKGAFTTWLYRITVNHCLNRRRKHHLPTVSLSKASAASLAERSSSFQTRLEDKEVIEQALSRLSERLRVVIILRYYWELSYAEIAQILDIPVGTVKSRLNLALKTMHEELETLTGDAYTICAVPQREVTK